MEKVIFGVDLFCLAIKDYQNHRIGLVTNDVATTTFGLKTRVALVEAGFQIVKLFSPEHGLSAAGADGVWVPNQTDELTDLPVISLYGDHLTATAEDLKNIDAVVFDIPDVGCRFYTYLWTMTHLMEVCAAHHKKFILLDRPNPLTGDLSKAEGPLLNAACTSFLGRWNIPIRHSCTMGELANYFANSYISNLDLEIIKAKNWNRNDLPNQGNWSFSPTSPAIKDAETALLYPGLGLMEGINVNEGRGTEIDFKVFGAPWINAKTLKENLDRLNLPGIVFSVTQYIPNWGIYEGELCFGLRLEITNKNLIKPVALGIVILKLLITNYPEDCKERLYQTNANPNGDGHLDKLLGIKNAFDLIKSNVPITTKVSKADWHDKITPNLFY